MCRNCGGWLLWSVLSVAASPGARPALAELADVYLKNGLKLRGDVRIGEGEVVFRNQLGELRYPREEVERVVPVGAPATGPGMMPTQTPAAPAESRPAELPAPPLLSALDIQRLKLHELRVDGVPEELRFRFARPQDEQELTKEMTELLSRRPGFLRDWERVLKQGTPAEKLQLIARETGARHADRITVVDDPEVFVTFRTHVLPLVVKGCAKSGCHSGPESQFFRLPAGSQRGTEFTYTLSLIHI